MIKKFRQINENLWKENSWEYPNEFNNDYITDESGNNYKLKKIPKKEFLEICMSVFKYDICISFSNIDDYTITFEVYNSATITVHLTEDDYYYVDDQDDGYKCDTINGLLNLIDEIFQNKIKCNDISSESWKNTNFYKAYIDYLFENRLVNNSKLEKIFNILYN